jgi:hypothetical protein
MNSRSIQNSKRLITGLVIFVASFGWITIASAGSRCVASCEMACCQGDGPAMECCGEDDKQTCPVVSSTKGLIWLLPKSFNDLATLASINSSFDRDDRSQVSTSTTVLGIAHPLASLVDLHVRLQI